MKKNKSQKDEEFYSNELFILYANKSLIESADYFKNITDAIHEMDNQFFFEVMEYGCKVENLSKEEAQFLNGHEYTVGNIGSELDLVVNDIIKYSKMPLQQAEIDNKQKNTPNDIQSPIAFEAVFGWSEIDCKDCDQNFIYGEDNPYLKKFQWMNTTLYFQNYRPQTNCFTNLLSVEHLTTRGFLTLKPRGQNEISISALP